MIFRHASNFCKRALKVAKLANANKTKEAVFSQKLGSHTFWQIASSVINKGKCAAPPLFNDPEMLSSAYGKAKLFTKNFSKNFNLDACVYLGAILSRTNLKLRTIPVTISQTNLDSANVSAAPNFIMVSKGSSSPPIKC